MANIVGDQDKRYRNTSVGVGTGLDARTAIWPGVDDWPVYLEGGSDVCWVGGRIEGLYPDSTAWDVLHSTGAFNVRLPRMTVQDLRIHNYGDGIRMNGAAPNFVIRDAHVSYLRDDCIENDYLHTGLVEDSLLDGCYVAFSARTYDGQVVGDGSNNLWTIRGSAVRLQPMPTVYKGTAPGHGGFFKWDSSGLGPKLALHDNVFRADQLPNHGDLGIPAGKLASCSNNVIVWLGQGPYPAPLPSCFTVTTDPRVWDNAVSAWQAKQGAGTTTLDTIAPTVSLTGLPLNSTLSGSVTLGAEATDNVGVAKVEFLVDGVVKGVDATAPYSAVWQTSDVANGTHLVTAKAYDAAGNSATSTSMSVNVSNLLTKYSTLTFVPSADASLKSGSPTTNFGTATKLVADYSPTEQALIKFTVSGINGRKIQSASLRLHNVNSSDKGGTFSKVPTSTWSENTVTYATAPAADAQAFASLEAVSSGQAYQVNMLPLVTGDGTFSLKIASTSGDGADYASKEATTVSQRPVLTVVVEDALSLLDISAPTTPANVTASAVSATQVNLGWSASADNVGVAKYMVYRGGVAVGEAVPPAYSDTNLAPNTTYQYSVVAVDASGNKSGFSSTVSVTTPPAPVIRSTLTFTPTDDTIIKKSYAATNFGTATSVKVDGQPIEDSLMKFNIAGVNGRRVVSAKLRLYSVNSSSAGGTFRKVSDTSWSERTVTWNNAPPASTSVIASLGAVTSSSWSDVDVASLIVADGVYSVRASSTSSNGAGYSSKESSTNRPQLVLVVE